MGITGFTPEQKHVVLERDAHKCPMCGHRATEVNHRANRGHGGFKGGNKYANACAICTSCNGLIESDGPLAEEARRRGVKLSRYDDPEREPYLHPLYRMPVWLTNDGSYTLDAPELATHPV